MKSFATIAIVTKSSISDVGWGSEFSIAFYFNIKINQGFVRNVNKFDNNNTKTTFET